MLRPTPGARASGPPGRSFVSYPQRQDSRRSNGVPCRAGEPRPCGRQHAARGNGCDTAGGAAALGAASLQHAQECSVCARMLQHVSSCPATWQRRLQAYANRFHPRCASTACTLQPRPQQRLPSQMPTPWLHLHPRTALTAAAAISAAAAAEASMRTLPASAQIRKCHANAAAAQLPCAHAPPVCSAKHR